MKTHIRTPIVFGLALLALANITCAFAAEPILPHKLSINPEIKKAFTGSDSIEIQRVTGTSANFQVGGTYRVTGVCHQRSLPHATLYLGNTAEAGPKAITAAVGSSLFLPLAGDRTAFDITFTVLRPG